MRQILKAALALALSLSIESPYAQIAQGGSSYKINSAGQQLVSITGIIPTYSAAGMFGATTGVLFDICGSATKTVVIRAVQISGTASTLGTLNLNFIKTSTAPTGGTGGSITPVPADSNNAAATASVMAYTATPTPGTPVGTFLSFSQTFPTPTTGGAANVIPAPTSVPQGAQPIVLRGTSQCAELQTSSSALTGMSMSVSVVWTEEAFFPPGN